MVDGFDFGFPLPTSHLIGFEAPKMDSFDFCILDGRKIQDFSTKLKLSSASVFAL
jgi:hypothetical protein